MTVAPPYSFVHGILQCCKNTSWICHFLPPCGLSQPRDSTRIFCISPATAFPPPVPPAAHSARVTYTYEHKRVWITATWYKGNIRNSLTNASPYVLHRWSWWIALTATMPQQVKEGKCWRPVVACIPWDLLAVMPGFCTMWNYGLTVSDCWSLSPERGISHPGIKLGLLHFW